MNRRTLIILVTLAVLIIAAVVGYAATRPLAESATSSGNPSHSSAPDAGDESTAPGARSGSYVDYSPTAVADAQGVALLFFHASWCPSCRQIESEILDQGVPDGVTVIKVDYDRHQDLRQKYGVTIQTTFVKVDASGKEIEKFVPYGGDLSLKLVLDTLT